MSGSINLNSQNISNGNSISAASFSGNGSSLTSLNASNISSGTIASARVPTLNQNTTGTSGGFTAGNASNLNSGTIPAARLPNHSASLLTSGTIPAARVPTLNQNTTGSSGSCTGNAASATQLQNARTISGASFNGTQNITLNNSNITNGAGYTTYSSNQGTDTNDNVNFASVTASGNITAYSDATLKKDVSTINDALGIVGKLRGVTYKWISNEQEDIGVIALEVEAVVPEVIKETEDGIKTVDYGRLVSVLINAVNELKAEIDELKGGK